MDQIKTGQFIGQLRKEKNMTQKELADKLGISDKTVSKWETGKGLPDASLFEPICEELNISITDLLAGTRVSPEEYSKKAEENIMALMKENQNNKNVNKQIWLGCAFLVVGIVFLFISTSGSNVVNVIHYFIDLPSILLITLISCGGAFISGAKNSLEFVRSLKAIVIPVGVIIFIFSIIVIMGNIVDLELLGPNLAVAFLSVFYSLIIYVIFAIVEKRIEKK